LLTLFTVSAAMVWEEEEALIRSRKNNTNNNMDSNFIQMAAVSSADEEQGRRRTAFTALNTGSPLRNDKKELDTTYHRGVEEDHHFNHQTPSNNGGKRQSRLREQLHSFRIMSAPYFRENREGRCLFAIMVALSLANSAVRVIFSYLSRDFWSALSNKEAEQL